MAVVVPPAELTEGPDRAWPSRWQAWLTIALLFLASIVSVIDRQILSVVVDPVRAELGISDVQISLLQGIAFGLFYATMGVWLGLVADRTNRRNLIIFGIVLWSLATLGGGIAADFGQFFASRMLVGLGEASLSPAAISLIADLFESGKRGRPIGVFLMGQAVANGIALAIAGAVLKAAAAGHFTDLPIIGAFTPWRLLFVISGLGGALIGLAFFLTKEPPRGTRVRAGGLGEQARHSLSYLRRNWRQFAGVYLGFAIYFLGAYGAGTWQIVFVSRHYAMSPAQVSLIFGPIAILFGLAGPLIGGWLVDKVVRRNGIGGLLRMLSIAPLLAIPSALAVFAPNAQIAIFLAATQSGCSAIVGAATLAYLQSAMPAELRGFSVSLTGLGNTLLGLALGPMLVAMTTQNILKDDSQVGWAIFWVAVPAFCVSAILYASARRARGAREARLSMEALHA
jgi:MFS family permease